MDDLKNYRTHGIFLRREALEAGYADKALYAAMANGSLVRVRQGAYVDGSTWRGSTDERRHLLRTHAAGLVHSPPFAASHISGAIAHGMRMWGVEESRVHLTRPAATVGRRHRDIAYHAGTVENAVRIEGTPVLSAVESAFGAACLTDVEAGTVILDSAYDLGLLDRADLAQQLEQHRGWPGTARMQITLRLAQPGSQSVGESRMRYLFWANGLPKPELQFQVRDGSTVVAHSDFAWPEHGVLGEFDGRVKYERFLRPGETPTDALIREKGREDRMRELTGWTVIRFVWADLYNPARTAERLRRVLGRPAPLTSPTSFRRL